MDKICTRIWVSESLIGENGVYNIAERDEKRVSFYWDIELFKKDGYHPLSITFKSEELVRKDQLEAPIGAKLKNLFIDCSSKPACYDDRMTTEINDRRRTLNIFYLDVTALNDPNVIGRSYLVDGFAFIIIPLNAGINSLPHEVGHCLYFTNFHLDGNDPISGNEHNESPNNLMYKSIDYTSNLDLEKKQIDSKNYSYLVNPHVLHTELPRFLTTTSS